MERAVRSVWCAVIFSALCVLPSLFSAVVHAGAELRVLSHNSFELHPTWVKTFERKTGAKLTWIKGGNAGQMVNKLILTKSAPIADVVLGIDNLLLARARATGVIATYRSPAAAQIPSHLQLGDDWTPTNYGVVALNYDKATLAKRQLSIPTQLTDFTLPQYKDQLVISHPATSSVGLALLVATVAHLGEAQAWQFWAKLRDNGLLVTHGWTDAYYKQFSLHGGHRPFVLSYTTSPAAEKFYTSKETVESPTAELTIPGAYALQVEGAAVVAGAKQPALAAAWIDFLLTPSVQADLAFRAWMYPIIPGVAIPGAFRTGDKTPQLDTVPYVEENQWKRWVAQWVRIVMRHEDSY